MSTAARMVLIEQMLDKVREAKYPSSELMDRVERSLRSADEATDYLGVLIEKISADKYPSLGLIDRALSIANAIERATEQDSDQAA
jgi:hypothetical protein